MKGAGRFLLLFGLLLSSACGNDTTAWSYNPRCGIKIATTSNLGVSRNIDCGEDPDAPARVQLSTTWNRAASCPMPVGLFFFSDPSTTGNLLARVESPDPTLSSSPEQVSIQRSDGNVEMRLIFDCGGASSFDRVITVSTGWGPDPTDLPVETQLRLRID